MAHASLVRSSRRKRNAYGQFITQKLPIALSCHAQLVESWMGQNVNSPFSNIRAVTFKLYSRSTRTALANRPASNSRP